MRYRAQELATEELGPRLEQDLQRTREREVTQARFTSLDRDLERRAQDGRVETRWSGDRYAESARLIARLRHLEGMRLAERVSATSWQLSEGWQTLLRDLGARNDILKQIHEAVAGDSSRYRVVGRGQAVPTDQAGGGPVVTGRVAAKGLSDELKGEFYAVIVTGTGRAYHVALDRRAAETVRTGDMVTFTTKPERRDHDAGAEPASGPIRYRLLFRKQPLSLQEQVRHLGPVWLDLVRTDGLAWYGFGAELREAVGRRQEVLRGHAVQPEDPSRSERLREMERLAVGKEVAVRSRQAFTPDTPNGFRGRAERAAGGFPGSNYAVVSDGSRFVVIRESSAVRGALGQVVTLTRDASGRTLVRGVRDRDGPTR